MKSIILGLVFIFSASHASANDLMVGQYTYHFDKYMCDTCGEYRKAHPLLGYATDKYAFIAMKNSFDRDSFVALRTFKYYFGSNVRGIASIGAGTGYSQNDDNVSVGKLTALGYFGVDIHPANDKFGVVVTFAPNVFIGVGLRFKVGD